jgi:hypothetical protein
MRVSNDDVLHNLEGVVQAIHDRVLMRLENFARKSGPSPNPSPEYRGGEQEKLELR